jgi:hypothetical protein
VPGSIHHPDGQALRAEVHRVQWRGKSEKAGFVGAHQDPDQSVLTAADSSWWQKTSVPFCWLQTGCGDLGVHHARTFLHGTARITLSVTVLPEERALPDEEKNQVGGWGQAPGRLLFKCWCRGFGLAGSCCKQAVPVL